MILDRDFYTQNDVVSIAKQLLGKVLYTRIDSAICSGIITETEAYAGITDKASHAYNDRRTPRTEIMYREGGDAYIYLIYGKYSLFNVVTNKTGVPHAILIRSIVPFEGLEIMQQRKGVKPLSIKDGIGPGRLSRLLGIDYRMTGVVLNNSQEGNAIWISDNSINFPEDKIQITKRIGIDYAKEDSERLYRFLIDSTLIDKH